MTRRVAGIDVGTNSLLLLIADVGPDGLVPVLDRSDITRLGEGVDRTRRLDAEAVERTLAQLAEYVGLCRDYGVEAVAAVGTSALRDATDRDAFLASARERCGLEIEVITGDREAELTFADVAASHAAGGESVSLLDIGGGSTEVVVGRERRIALRRSVDVGSNRLTERVPLSDPPLPAELAEMRGAAAGAVAGLPPVEGVLVGSGGTITTLAALDLGLATYDSAAVGRHRLTLSAVTALAERLGGLSLAARSAVPGLEPKRAPVIVAGALILEQALTHLGHDGLMVSAGGLRFALARLAAEA